MSLLDADEHAILFDVANEYGVDYLFLCAIRRQEAGKPGGDWGEMGVPTAMAIDFRSQVKVTAATVRNRLVDYPVNPLAAMLHQDKEPNRRLCYNRDFVRWFASRSDGSGGQTGWAPRGAGNDPQDLNKNWADNVISIYAELVAKADPSPNA